MPYSKVVLDALVEKATETEVGRMVVVINQLPSYREYADFHKFDPEWWENLGEKIYTSSPYPQLALAPFLIAAEQYLLSNKELLETKVVPLVGKAMAIDEESDSVQSLAKVTMGVKMGALEIPSMQEMRQNVLPKLLKHIKKLDEKLTYREE
jgi:hypothetical protein